MALLILWHGPNLGLERKNKVLVFPHQKKVGQNDSRASEERKQLGLDLFYYEVLKLNDSNYWSRKFKQKKKGLENDL